MATLSVILPVRNAERYVAATVRSVLEQTYRDFECIIIDDASSDRSLDILRRIDDPRIRLVTNDPHLGLIKTLNKGLAMATGRYIARCDADDVSDARRFERQMAFLEQHPAVGVLGTNVWLIDADGRVTGTAHHFPCAPIDMDVRLRWGSPFYHSSVVFRKDLVERAGGYPETWPHIEDYALWLRLFRDTQFANLTQRLVCYRIHSASVTGQHHVTQREGAGKARAVLLDRDPARPMDEYAYLDEKWATVGRADIQRRVLRERMWINKREPGALVKLARTHPMASLSAAVHFSGEVVRDQILVARRRLRNLPLLKPGA